ncbi:helix-turn-helix domain-containing protein [Rhodococcus sp. JS3073]|uniref:helix-turn-helix domain-containing protein n=1 Tax=Rhodococcus sp. JS3073 TaxID=3002901 RepID=UPI002286007C|nr:helix-turn-helix transcriptional regulator [Rhodococcus sp. JS3073]WAM17519.1 helix-turn-helix transcriptional regulator [Rhodococcus sp. JS3073]
MTTTDLGRVVGLNSRKLRLDAGATLEQVSQEARKHGWPWSLGRVGDLESGKVQPTLPTVLALASVLSAVTETPVRLADLVATDATVELSHSLVVEGADLVSAVSGEPVSWRTGGVPERHPERDASLPQLVRAAGWPEVADAKAELGISTDETLGRVLEALESSSLADRRAAKSLGVDLGVLLAASFRLWGKSLGDEREARVEPDAGNQRRGQVTRQLRSELAAELGL